MSMPSKLYLRKKAIEELMKVARDVELKNKRMEKLVNCSPELCSHIIEKCCIRAEIPPTK
jgi:hypothetical protein